MDGNKVVTPTFTENPPVTYSLTVNVVGSGSVARVPDQVSYVSGSVVSLTATPVAGWSFSGWSGDLIGSVNPASVTMDGNKVVTATFTENPPVTYSLTVSVVGSGSVVRVPDQVSYVSGSVVSLTATPVAGWSFSGWSGDLTGSVNPASVTMDGNKVVTATFTENPPVTYSLTVSVVGSGSVVRVPDQVSYVSGSVVSLTATPGAGWSFSGWSGDLTGSVNPASVTMDGNKVVTATFTEN